MIEYLIKLLKTEYKLATLSRGYGRKTKGYLDVNPGMDAKETGDEPMQFAQKFDAVDVAVCEKRVEGIARLRKKTPVPQVVLLDDVFQHRSVKPGLLIMLTAYADLFYTDYVLPAGNLREARVGAARADYVVVTKCPSNLSEVQQLEIRDNIAAYSKAPVYFASIAYEVPQGISGTVSWESLASKLVTVVTGIAKPTPFLRFIQEKGIAFEHREFKDHHNFTETELAELDKKTCILTTEKDYVRLAGKLKNTRVYYVPISFRILKNAEDFDRSIQDFVRKNRD